MAVHVSPAHALERLAHRMPMDADKQRAKLIPRITQPPCQRFVDPRLREMFAFSISGSSPEKKFDALLLTREAKIM